jgi:hypothetical protein
MRRLMMLVTVVLLITAMLVATAVPALAAALRPPVAKDGTPAPATVCESPLATSPSVGWRNGTCWVSHPTATSLT